MNLADGHSRSISGVFLSTKCPERQDFERKQSLNMFRAISAVTLLLFGSSVLCSQPYTISTIAGTDRVLDGSSATSAPLRSPIAVAADSGGNLFIADRDDNRIRKVSSSGIISTFAGTGAPGFSGDRGKATAAHLTTPVGVALDTNGDLYIADRGNARIRRVSPDGTINTVAGNGVAGFAGDNGPALSAEIDPTAVAIDNKGNIYIADGLNCRIRKVDGHGTITTIAGTGVNAYAGDNGPATSALIGFVGALTADSSGNVYIGDLTNAYVRKIDTSGQITPVAGSGFYGTIDDGGPATRWHCGRQFRQSLYFGCEPQRRAPRGSIERFDLHARRQWHGWLPGRQRVGYARRTVFPVWAGGDGE
jgi:hypothetical protein